MKRIEIKKLKTILFIENSIIEEIKSYTCGNEKAGYLFFKKIKSVNEYICCKITPPHKKDRSTKFDVSMSWSHKRLSRRIQKNRFLKEMGFYHTHPNYFDSKMSNYDRSQFTKKSKKYLLSLFIICTKENISLYVYSYGTKIGEIHE